MNDALQLFDPGPPDDEQLSDTQRRTIRQKIALARGVHPLMGGPLDANPAHTCGSCALLRSQERVARTYWKCSLYCTRSESTDVRLSWPGCTRWMAHEGHVRTVTGPTIRRVL